MKTKALSVFLVIALVFGLCGNALAASVTPSLSNTEVQAGEQVNVILDINTPLADIGSLQYDVYYDDALFTFTAGNSSYERLTMDAMKEPTSGKAIVRVMFIDTSLTPGGNPGAFDVGNLCTLTFTAKADVTEDAAGAFSVREMSLDNSDYTVDLRDKNYNGVLDVTVKAPVEPVGYTVAISPAAQTKACGAEATVSVKIDSEDAETYSDYLIVVTYDKARLQLVTTGDSITAGDGSVMVHAYGDLKNVGTGFDLTFKCLATGEAKVEIDSAVVDHEGNVHGQDAPAATITAKTATITIGGYPVTLDDALFDGEDSVEPNEDYTFTADDPYYDFDFTGSTMGGEAVTVTDNGDGTFTVEDVTGPLVIEATATPKSYDVTVTGSAAADVTAAATATYKTDYVFSVEKDPTYNYSVPVVTIGGEAYTGFTTDENTYTIPGADIKGDIVISIAKTAQFTIEVTQYVKLDGKAIFLVLVSGDPGDGKNYAYNGSPMYYDDQYAAYAYLTVESEELTADAAAELVTIVSADEVVHVTKNSDVNQTGKTDINDAQLVWNMYNARYEDFDTVSMIKFLRADMNGSKTLTVDDATAVISAFLA